MKRQRWYLPGVGLAILLLAGSAANGQEKSAAAVPALEDLVPEGTMAILAVPDVAGSVREYRRTVMGQMAEYVYSRDFQSLLRHLGAGGRGGEMPDFRKALADQIKQATGSTYEEILDLFEGECAIALVGVDMTDPERFPMIDLVAKIGWKDAAKGEAIVRHLLKNERSIKEIEIAGYKALAAEDTMVSPMLVFTPSCLIFGTQRKTTETLLSALKAPARAAGGGKGIEKPLSTNGEYALAMKNVRKDQANVAFYLNWERVVNLPSLRELFENEAPDLMDDLGFDNLKSVAFTIRIKDAKMADRMFLRMTGSKRKGFLATLATAKTTTPDGILLSGEGDVSCLATLPVAAGVMAAIAIPAVISVRTESVSIKCRKNLKSLCESAYVYASRYGGPNKNFPDETGKAFWEALSAPGTDVLGGDTSIYRCPYTSKTGICYRGPKKKMSEVPAAGVIGCDDPDNHPDGSICVLLRDTSVQIAEKGSELYKRALEETSE